MNHTPETIADPRMCCLECPHIQPTYRKMPNLARLCVFFISCLPLLASPTLVKLPLAFEENRGQATADVQFLARTPGYSVSLLAGAVEVRSGAGRFRMRFPGSRRRVRPEALDPLPGKVNYFVGRHPRDWHAGIPTFGKVLYKSLYRSVDLVFHAGPGNQLEYDFRIAPDGRVFGPQLGLHWLPAR